MGQAQFLFRFSFVSTEKRRAGGGKTQGLAPRNDVLTTGFIRFSLARIFFAPRGGAARPPPPPPPPQKPRRHFKSRCSKRFDHITNHRKESPCKFCRCSEPCVTTLKTAAKESSLSPTNRLSI